MPERDLSDGPGDVMHISVDGDRENIWLTRVWRGDLENDVLRMTEEDAVATRDLLDEFLTQNGGNDDAN